ncbi:DUF86 domain-containing protein [Candidatus Kaiserbacteria bacterium]|nr:DUF86 domain-containing protein [Candidatus Kaiserbacteria bacterium]
MKTDDVHLAQMRDAVAKIKRFTEGMDEPSFKNDEKTQSAVIMQLAIIGELAKRLSQETKSTIALPWKEIAGFRDNATHDYFEIDLAIVWTTVTADVPVLAQALGA